MPTRKYHLEFDNILRDRGVIYEDTFGDTVHSRLDKNVKKYGPDHRELDDWHQPESIRIFIYNMEHWISQETATDYLRIAYGHVVLDSVVSKMKIKEGIAYCRHLNMDKAYKRALQKFYREGYHRKKYHFIKC